MNNERLDLPLEAEPGSIEPVDGDPIEGDEEQLTDKLDRLAGGRTISEQAPAIPRGPRGARAAALQALFEEDLTGHPSLRALERLPAFARLSEVQMNRAKRIVRFVNAERSDLDARVATVAKQFPTDQMGTVDRNILRIALAELETDPDTSHAVIVNEAVELAKLFGSDSSPRFINGVLGALLR